MLSDAPQLAEPEDDEKLRFVSRFGDVFVTLGIGLFAGAIGYMADRAYGVPAVWGSLVLVSWPLAEFFTRRRRMALPSIVLLCLFVAGTFGAAFCLITFGLLGYGLQDNGDDVGILALQPPVILAPAALVTALMVAVHYWRFRVPITIAAGSASLAGAAIGVLFVFAPSFAHHYVKLIILTAGLAILALAMRFDLSDSSRVTRRTTSRSGSTFSPRP